MLEKIHNLGLDGHIQGGYGLIRHQQLRLHGQCPGNGHPLALSPGHLAGVFVQEALVHAHIVELEGGLLPIAAPGRADMVNAHGLGDDVRHLHPLVQAGGGVLENQLPVGLQQLPVGPEGPVVAGVDSVEADLAPGGPVQIHHAPGHGGFSAAGFPHQAQNLPPANGEGHIVHGGEGVLPAQPEPVGQVADGDNIFIHIFIHGRLLQWAASPWGLSGPGARWRHSGYRTPGT